MSDIKNKIELLEAGKITKQEFDSFVSGIDQMPKVPQVEQIKTYDVPKDSIGTVLFGFLMKGIKSTADIEDGIMAFINRGGSKPEGPYMTQRKGNRVFLTRIDCSYEITDSKTPNGFVECVGPKIVDEDFKSIVKAIGIPNRL